MRACVLAAAGLAGSMAVGETLILVSNSVGFVELDTAATAVRLTAMTVHQTTYPDSVGAPAFWLDCAQTNGWTFAADGSVAKIPSRVGDRYLATDAEGGIHEIQWNPKNPRWVAADNTFPYGGYLDFGVKGSLCAMSFNKVGPSGFETNVLENIGTVIAVWYSSVGDTADGEGGYYGGALLGGGFGSDGVSPTIDKSQYVNYRGTGNDRAGAGESGSYRPRWYDSFLADPAHTHAALREGWVRHNGQMTSPVLVGFAGDWEVVSVVPNITYGLMNATGLGMNDSRISGVSGGFKVAEILYYDRALTLDETKRVEAYLNAKWFGVAARGDNGNAAIGRLRVHRDAGGEPEGAQLAVEVVDGETLTIDKLWGGRGPRAVLEKSGDGTLSIGDASAYGGTVKLGGGTLSFLGRTIPTALPHSDYIHFDASSADSLVTDAEGRFAAFRNLAAKSLWKAASICARPDGFVPRILADELGAGLPILDFGDYTTEKGRMIFFATNETAAVQEVLATPAEFTTLLVVVGAARGGGTFVKAARDARNFSRNNADDFSANLIQDVSVSGLSAHEHATAFVNGVAASPAQGFEGPGYQVVAIRRPGAVEAVGLGGSAWGSGGLRLGEIVLYRRALTDREMQDGSAYLMRKWLGKTAPGYSAAAVGATPAIREVVATADASVRVEAGTVAVGRLASEEGVLTKTGPGALAYQSLDVEKMRVQAGGLVKSATPDVSSADELAAGPALHLDASDATTLRVSEVGGERRVLEWYSTGDRTVMAVPASIGGTKGAGRDAFAPFLSDDVRLNGHATVDFGPYTVKAGGRALSLSRSFDAVRHAYVVWCPRDAGDSRGQVLGCSKGVETNGNYYDFLRGGTEEASKASTPLLALNRTAGPVQDGTTLTNGVVVVPTSYVPPPGVFTVTEFHPTCGVHVSGLGTDRDVDRFSGGVRIAEVVLYERDLSAREQTATRNYLMKKWFGAAPAPLPDPVEAVDSIRRLDVDGAGEFVMDGETAVEALVGSGSLDLKGNGTFELLDSTAFDGIVSVAAGGTLKLVGTTPATFGELAAPNDILFHVDAAQGLTTVTNTDGVIEVTEWKSTRNDGWSAVPFDEAHRPTILRADDLGRREVVDMAKGARQAMLFAKNGETNLLEGIGSAFWVLGSQNGGGYLLGGGHHYNNWDGGRFNFMRNGPSGGQCDKSEYALLNTGWTTPDNLKTATWRLDGTAVNPTEVGLSGAWDLVSMNITDQRYPTSNAEGFAFDGRTITGGSYTDRLGCQRLAEVVLYKRALTDAEREDVEAYLRAKWRFNGTLAGTSPLSVALAAGGTLDLGGRRQHLASLTGAGTVRNGTLALGTLVADPTVARPTCEGVMLDVREGQPVLVRNGTASAETDIPILACSLTPSSVRRILRSAVFAFENFTGLVENARLVYEGGVLKVRFEPRGLLLFVR